MIAPGAQVSDGELVRRVVAGDRDAYTVLVERHQGLLFRQAYALVNDSDAAADLVQDAFVRAYRDLRRCREPERFRAWVFTIVRNGCRDYLKNVRRRSVPWDSHGTELRSADDPHRGSSAGAWRRRWPRSRRRSGKRFSSGTWKTSPTTRWPRRSARA